jgi:hypothetical protein
VLRRSEKISRAQHFLKIVERYPACATSGHSSRSSWPGFVPAIHVFGAKIYLYLGNVSAIGHSASFPSTPAAYTWKIQENIVRAGVNYHF